MKHQWMVYAIVVVLSIGVGVGIAGLPSSESVGPALVPVPTTSTTLPAATSTVPTAIPATDPAATTTTTAPPEPAPTTAPPTSTTTTTLPPLPERSAIGVIVANGANIGGIASSTADALEELGYVDVRATDGSEVVFFSIVYYVDGAEAVAVRMTEDLDLEPTSIAPIADAPDIVGDLEGESLLVYLGSDQG